MRGSTQRMGSTFLWPMDIGFVRPTHLGPSGLVFCFYPLQLPPSPDLVRRYLRKGINWGDGQINSCWRFYVHGLMVEIQTWMVTNFNLGCVWIGWKPISEINFRKIHAFGCHGKHYFPGNDFRLTTNFTFDPEMNFSPHFHFNSLPERERERERESAHAWEEKI